MVNKKDNNSKKKAKRKAQKKKSVNNYYHVDELLLEEHNSVQNLFQFFEKMLQQTSTFYFAVIATSFSVGILTLINSELYSLQKVVIIIVLTMFYATASMFWYCTLKRTLVKLLSNVERGKHIEEYFRLNYGKCLKKSKHSSYYFNNYAFQNLTYTNNHLDKNEDHNANKIIFLARDRSILLTKFPLLLLLIWLIFICLAYVYFL